MTQTLPWMFEPCDPEGARDQTGTPWAHAVRGRRPAHAAVVGYGHTEPAADVDARQKASQADAREVLGQRGEVTQLRMVSRLGSDGLTMITVYDAVTHTPLAHGRLAEMNISTAPISRAFGSCWSPCDMPFMPIGT